MCTAATYHTKDHYFGRNLDMEYHYRESVTVIPRNFLFSFLCLPPIENHYAVIAMANV
jgi:choloylglycine hydrolase